MSDLISDAKVNRPGPGIAALAHLGVPALYNEADQDLSFGALLKRIMLAAGVNHIVQVNDCETAADYTESDSGTFDIAASAAAGKRVGTNCMKLVATAACDGSQYVETKLINESAYCQKEPVGGTGFRFQDWSDTAYIGFWNSTASSGDFGTAGEMQMALVYDGGQVSTLVNIGATVTTVHQWEEHALSEFGIPLDRIEGIRFYCSNVNAAEYVQYDDIIRYLISFNGAPLYGGAFPIKASTTLANGDSGKWTVDGLIKSNGAGDNSNVGPLELFASTLTGNGGRGKWGSFKGAHIGIVRAGTGATAGDFLEWESNGHYNDVTTTAIAEGVCVALESAGAAEDDIFVLFMHGAAVG